MYGWKQQRQELGAGKTVFLRWVGRHFLWLWSYPTSCFLSWEQKYIMPLTCQSSAEHVSYIYSTLLNPQPTSVISKGSFQSWDCILEVAAELICSWPFEKHMRKITFGAFLCVVLNEIHLYFFATQLEWMVPTQSLLTFKTTLVKTDSHGFLKRFDPCYGWWWFFSVGSACPSSV